LTEPARRDLLVAGLLAVLVLALRGWTFGNPMIHIDEQFYLLVGERMLHGSLPYVDIWDRKPFGLFLLYAGIAAVSPDAIIGYQLAASACVAGTAWLLYVTLHPHAGRWAGATAAAAYPAWIVIFDGLGGQAEVFGNLLLALAAWGVLRLLVRSPERFRFGPGVAIMLLAGLSLQIKYTYVVQALYLGLSLQFACYRGFRSVPRLLAWSAGWIAAALLPTAAAAAWYAAIGHFDEFVQANLFSILARRDELGGIAVRMVKQLAIIAPLAALSLLVWLRRSKVAPPHRSAAAWLLGWSVAAILGYFALPAAHYSYVLPLLPALLASAAWGLVLLLPKPFHPGWAGAALVVFGGAVGLYRQTDHGVSTANAAQVRKLTQAVGPLLKGGCLYLESGPPILYRQTGSCLATPFIFPGQLSDETRQGELGRADPRAEMDKLLACPPTVVVAVGDDVGAQAAAGPMMSLLAEALRRDYRVVERVSAEGQDYLVYARSARLPASCRAGRATGRTQD
jgi:hypothetical protein